MKIAAVGDLHYDGSGHEVLTELARGAREGDALVLCGDLTTHGDPEQMRDVAAALDTLDMPVVSVLGNHDYDSDEVGPIRRLLEDAGVAVLDGGTVVVGDVGFAGVKGFPGGFGRGALGAFGEPEVRAFAQAAVDEALKLENALRNLRTRIKVVVLHYAPLVGTVEGEPPEIYPYLGSSRLLSPVEMLGADVVFHGHAHTGSPRATTPEGVPVYNVSLPLLRTQGRTVLLWTVPDGEGTGEGGRETTPEKATTSPIGAEDGRDDHER